MHKKYLFTEKSKLAYNIPIIIYTEIVLRIISYIIERCLFNYSDQLIELKAQLDFSIEIQQDSNINIANTDESNNNKENSNKNEKFIFSQKIEKYFVIKKIIFYIIAIILNLFYIYFCACFFAVYKETQRLIGIDLGIGQILDLITCLIKCLIIFSIRSFSITCDSKIWKTILKIIGFLFIELVLEIGIILIEQEILEIMEI